MNHHVDTASAGRTIQSVETCFALLEKIRSEQGTDIATLSDAVGLSRSTVHHYLTTLRNRGYVVRREDGTFDIGIRFLVFGGYSRFQLPIYQHGKEGVDKLAEETGETARLVVPRFGYGITIYQSMGSDVSDAPTYVGSYEPLHSTAAGKAILAALDAAEVEDILEHRGLTEQTEHTTTDRQSLYEELERVRSSGIAFDDEEQFDGIRCVATSITALDRIVGAISVQMPIERADEQRFDEDIPGALQNAAGVIEINTTFSVWDSEDG